MKVAVTGAGGFVGKGLLHRLAAERRIGPEGAAISRLVALDADFGGQRAPGIEYLEGDFGSEAVLDRLREVAPDIVFHLAAMPGGAVARDPRAGWRTNVEALDGLLTAVSRTENPARFVFASSIGVFGVPLPADKVDDDTLPLPTLSYGAHKIIGETMVADCTRRGQIDGVSIRLPGIIARPRAGGGHLSAYMSDILHALRAGEPFVCPVSRGARSWFMSRRRCVDNFLHAASISTAGLARRSFNLPALHLSMEELIAGAAAHFGSHVGGLVTFEPNAELEAQFGAYPQLVSRIARDLGFRDDGDAPTLVARALDLDRPERSVSKGAAA